MGSKAMPALGRLGDCARKELLSAEGLELFVMAIYSSVL
jgi:hypothetical protein